MKRFAISLFLLIALAVSSPAETLSPSRAKSYAEKFFNIPASTKAAGTPRLEVVKGYEPSKRFSIVSAEPAFYIFNKSDGGFVIISAESEYHPILGYSMEGTFDTGDIPDGLQWIFDIFQAGVNRVRLTGAKATEEIRREWETIGVSTKADSDIKLLATAEWGQEDPYNGKCPTVTGESSRSITGCVATATAILMHWQATHRENVSCTPAQVTLPNYTYTNSYTGKSVTITGHSLVGRTYDFQAMPVLDADVKTASSTVKNNIADLMHDIGVAYEMQYSSQGSGAHSEKAVTVLGTYFNYRKDNRTESRGFFSEDEWYAKIKESIDNDNPVFYAGVDPSQGGHCFLIDGYDDSRKRVRINFGWNGSRHGTGWTSFYYIGDEFSREQTAVFNLVPNTDGGEYEYPSSKLYYYPMGDVYGITAENAIEPGKAFTLQCGYINQTGPAPKKYHIRGVFVSREGERTTVSSLYGTQSSIVPLGMVSWFSDMGPVTFGPERTRIGDRIEMEYSEDFPADVQQVKTWLPLDQPSDGSVVTACPMVPMFFIDLPKTISPGTYPLRLKNGDYPWLYDTEWTMSLRPEGDYSSRIDTRGDYSFAVFNRAGTYEVVAKVTFNGSTETIRTVVEVK